MRKIVFVFLIPVLLLAAAPASAQPVLNYRLSIYNQGAAAPITSVDIFPANVTCGQPKVAQTATVVNPASVRWNDPADAALDCVWTPPALGPLFALPFSTTLIYEATLNARNGAGSSQESTRSNPFSMPGAPPATPANVRLRP